MVIGCQALATNAASFLLSTGSMVIPILTVQICESEPYLLYVSLCVFRNVYGKNVGTFSLIDFKSHLCMRELMWHENSRVTLIGK